MNPGEYERMYRLEDRHWWFVARRRLLARILARWLRPRADGAAPRRLLDVGCGTGATLKTLRRFGDAAGVDVEPRALCRCRERGERRVALSAAEALPFPDESFDAVTLLDVLEHVAGDAAACREAARVLVPAGIFVATVPAYRALWSEHDVALMHRRRYAAGEVRALVEGAGLELERLTCVVAAPLPVAWAVRRFRRPPLPPGRVPRSDTALPVSGLVNAVLAAWLDIEGRIALRAGLPFGLSIVAVARKPDAGGIPLGRNASSQGGFP